MYCKLSTLRETLLADDISNSSLVGFIETASAWVDSLYPHISPFGEMEPITGDDTFAVPNPDPQANSGFDLVRASGDVDGRVITLLAVPKFTHPAFGTVFFEDYSVHQYRQTSQRLGSFGGSFGGQESEARHYQLKAEITSASMALELFDNGLPIPPIRAGTQILLGPPVLIQRATLLYAKYLAWVERKNKGIQVENDYVRRILFEAEETLQVKKPTTKADDFAQTGIATARPHPLISIARSSQRIVL